VKWAYSCDVRRHGTELYARGRRQAAEWAARHAIEIRRHDGAFRAFPGQWEPALLQDPARTAGAGEIPGA